MFWGGDEGLLAKLFAGEDKIVLLGGERLAEDNGVEAGNLSRARGELRHGLDVAEVIGARDAPLRRRIARWRRHCWSARVSGPPGEAKRFDVGKDLGVHLGY